MILLPTIGELGDKRSIHLATRANSWIRNQRRDPQNPVLMRDAVATVQAKCQSAEVRSLDTVYNCFGLVFGSRRTTIFETEIDKILTEDRYKEIDRADVKALDIVVYRQRPDVDPDHAALVVSAEFPLQGLDSTTNIILVASQWGALGEYVHNVDHFDEQKIGSFRQFYTDRKI